MRFTEFKKAMAKAKPGKHIPYHVGSLIDDRADVEVDLIARFVMALYELDHARLYQKRIENKVHYFIVLTQRLRTRRDQSGSFQEAERLMELI